MMSEKYDIIKDAEAIIEQWDSEEFDFTSDASSLVLNGKHWRENYSGKLTIPNMFPFAVSEFKKDKDIYHRDTSLDKHDDEMMKQDSYFKMISLAEDIIQLFNLAKTSHFKKPGEGYKRKLAELTQQVKELTAGKEEWEKVANDALDMSRRVNANRAEIVRENEMLKAYGRFLAPKFIQEAKKYHDDRTQSTAEESGGDSSK